MQPHDIDAVLAIQAASPEIAPWTAADYEIFDRFGLSGWVVERDARVLGFIFARQVVDELEILNLAVHPDSRRRGVGSLLLGETRKWAMQRGATKVYLEVRASNAAAVRFYERHGFKASGRRTHYYTAPVEDALLLALQLSNS
jgi:[ribosomal protein S18]-alanine N-acetyltransferase